MDAFKFVSQESSRPELLAAMNQFGQQCLTV